MGMVTFLERIDIRFIPLLPDVIALIGMFLIAGKELLKHKWVAAVAIVVSLLFVAFFVLNIVGR